MFIREKGLIFNSQNVEAVRPAPYGTEVIMVSGRVYTVNDPRLVRKLSHIGRGRLARLLFWIFGK